MLSPLSSGWVLCYCFEVCTHFHAFSWMNSFSSAVHNRFSNFDILLITFSPCLVFSSSRKCETLGYWSAMFSNNNDEDRPHQAYWVYGIFKKVWHLFTLSKNTVKLPSSSFDFFVSAVFDLFPSHLFFFICCLTICKLYPPAKRRVSPKRSLAAV